MAAGTIRLVSGEAAGTPPAGCVHIYSKANKKLYYKDDTGTEYELGTGGGAAAGILLEVEYLTLSADDIANKQLTLAKTPVDPTMVMWDITSGSLQMYSDDFVVSGTTLSWNGKAPESFLEVGDTCRVAYVYETSGYQLEVEYVTLDSTMVTNKQIVLQYTPDIPENVTWTITSGSEQNYLDDFTVSGNILSWAGKPLDGILDVGDSCRITYTFNPP